MHECMVKHSITYCFLLLFLVLSMSCSKDNSILDPSDIFEKDSLGGIGCEDVANECIYSFVGAEKYMDLSKASSGGQGSANYGDFFFQGYANNSVMDVYNLRTKSFLCRIPISQPKSSSLYHANTLNFGNQFYAEDDEFPVLYVCSGYTLNNSTESFVFVYRIIQKEDDKFQLELIQTITLDFGTWTEAILDNEHNAIWIKDSTGYRKYIMPSIFGGDCKISSWDFALAEIKHEKRPFSHDQGHLFYDDRIWFATGVPGWNEKTALIIINTLTGKREGIIDFLDLGLFNPSNPQDNCYEPEGVIVYDNQIMICFRNFIYSLK